MSPRRQIVILDVPEWVARQIERKAGNRSINDTCAEILAAHFGVPYESTYRRREKPARVGRRIVLKVPEPLWLAVKDAAHPYSTMQAQALNALEEHFSW